ncbi:hypothetical protein DN062_00360 [Nitrincola tibetensis]|uniref:Uncharacterized protein n=1 Tax=Nitrincola tibetensis TaxID=2219697 RepID=A0A364NRS2_9GAMM|nr:hypothetical protein DN062_00360 [Nitrincola tibetensis]
MVRHCVACNLMGEAIPSRGRLSCGFGALAE